MAAMTKEDSGVCLSDHQTTKSLLASLSIEDQISLLTGQDYWRTTALPKHGIPALKTTDGPNGARGEFFTNGTPAALFPCGTALAATWNVDLIERIAERLGIEAKARGAHVLLAPTVCLHRSPLGGRNFESFSEDPFLSGKLASAYVRGLQSEDVAATIKHFVGNEQETHRMRVSSKMSERALRELYLKPFEIAIRESEPWAVMTAYNRLNGTHCDQNEYLLNGILRGEWDFDGLVMSDWGGTTSIGPSVLAGCDLEMPNSGKWRQENLSHLLQALEADCLKRRGPDSKLRKAIERSAANVIKLIKRSRGFHSASDRHERSLNDPETRQIIREAGVEGITLLKNDSRILPLKRPNTIAVIGPNAKRAVTNGGGSASLNPEYKVSPLEGIRSRTDAEIRFAQGCDSWKWVPLATDFCTTPDGKTGVVLEYYDGPNFEGPPIRRMQQTTTDLYLWDSPPAALRNKLYSFRVSTRITPTSTGLQTLGFSSVGPGRLLLNGSVFIDNWEWTKQGEAMFGNSAEVIKKLRLEQDVPIDIVIESTNEIRPRAQMPLNGPDYHYGGCRIGYHEEPEIDLLKEAVETAKASDVAIVVVGLDAEWESEGYDRKDMALPKDGSQDRLVEAVVDANPNTIVVNQSGSPVCMPWADKVLAIVQAWYQGQEAGNALADVLFGIHSPDGKLPTTFPKSIEDTPAYGSWAGDKLEVEYKEDIFLGYRFFEKENIKPLFPFGHGLSYTTFSYGEATISNTVLSEYDILTIEVPVRNTGEMAGSEIVQAYVRDVDARVAKPAKELKAFAKIFIPPNDTKIALLVLDKHSVSYYDTERRAWVAEKGRFDVLIGASSTDIRREIQFEVCESFSWIF
ncbi:beta-glucosidase-like protein [Rhizodiscina lignyota]|uniref:beta-glucosidase n=1 Tax=Rhizodiscina lignyota TaxID=1504668 RepID=A0A9P4IJK3_9PEZI|nr:beta-glucosidase-like protein [Rhizodiscina lignyota]